MLSIHDLSAEMGQWTYVFNKTATRKLEKDAMIGWAKEYLEGKLLPTIRNDDSPSLSSLLQEYPPGSGSLWELNYSSLMELLYGEETLSRILPGSSSPPSRRSPLVLERKSLTDFDLIVMFYSRTALSSPKIAQSHAHWKDLAQEVSFALKRCLDLETNGKEDVKERGKALVFAAYNVASNSQPQNFHHLRELPAFFLFRGVSDPLPVSSLNTHDPLRLFSWYLDLGAHSFGPDVVQQCKDLFPLS